MAAIVIPGQRTWSMTRDAEGHREYKITHMVLAHPLDGPARVLNAFGLPRPGDLWIVDNDIDLWAWCRPNATVNPVLSDEPNRHWLVESTFSTKPPDKQRCQDTPIEDPLLEPAKISGGFQKYTEEATADRFGVPILNSAHQVQKGPKVEFDMNRPTVKIEQNVATFAQAFTLPNSMIDHVNDRILWGLPKRTAKLSNASWERKFFGQCHLYYTRTLEFDINYQTFDRDLMDSGTALIHGEWDEDRYNRVPLNDNGVLNPDSAGVLNPNIPLDPNPYNPSHFIKAKDKNDEPKEFLLNGKGEPVNVRIKGAINDISYNVVPTVITSYKHGLVDGTRIVIQGAIGMLFAGVNESHPANNFWTITVIDQDTFSLNLSAQNLVSYVGGGIWYDLTPGQGPAKIHVEKYAEANFLLLGIPTIF